MKNKAKIRGIATGAIISTVYILLTYISAIFGLSSGAIQIRLSEVLTVLPIFTPYAIPGLFIGCLLSNILTGCAVTDVIFGSLATLIGAVLTYSLRKRPYISLIPPIAANTVLIPFILIYTYNLSEAYWYFALTVFAGEFISCGILGTFLRKSLTKKNIDKYL